MKSTNKRSKTKQNKMKNKAKDLATALTKANFASITEVDFNFLRLIEASDEKTVSFLKNCLELRASDRGLFDSIFYEVISSNPYEFLESLVMFANLFLNEKRTKCFDIEYVSHRTGNVPLVVITDEPNCNIDDLLEIFVWAKEEPARRAKMEEKKLLLLSLIKEGGK
jgi:hypothetical protein